MNYSLSSDILNDEISTKETYEAICKINPNKASGCDGILGNFITNTLTKLFNYILMTGQMQQQWSESIICPIHKSGQINDPNNYRGISLVNVMYKVFSSILNNRLCKWVSINNHIDESQAVKVILQMIICSLCMLYNTKIFIEKRRTYAYHIY